MFPRTAVVVIGLFLMVTIVTPGCGKTEPDSKQSTATPKVTTPAAAMGSWQAKWDMTLERAKKEGVAVVYGDSPPLLQRGMASFTDKYGIKLEYVTGRPAEVAPKLLAERNGGMYLADILTASTITALTVLKPAGALEPMDDTLILPEVIDPNGWFGGHLYWMDKEHTHIAFFAYAHPGVAINTQLVQQGEIKNYRDLLHPKWKGKIVMDDPRVGGGGNSWFTAMAEGIMNLDYLRELARQELVLSRDRRQQMEWVARGRYPVILAPNPDQYTEFRRAGAPIEAVDLEEGTYVTQGVGAVSLINKTAHPNAAKLLINWMLSKEGQTILSKTIGSQSARIDVPTDSLDTLQVRKPGRKYFNTMYAEYQLKKAEYLKVAEGILAARP